MTNRPSRFKIRLLTSAVLLTLCISGASLSLASQQHLPNIEMPTLGGTQVWQDTYIYAQWRIQKNIVTGHSRLLNPDNVRKAWGSYNACKNKFDQLRKASSIRPASRHTVILLHGIARSTGTFSEMKLALTANGYDAAVISYPSTRRTIEDHAGALANVLNRLEGTETVSFVSHSMGGLVLRHLLAANEPWTKTLKIGRVVMIAPPNQGSTVAKALENNLLYKAIYGKSGQQLVPDAASKIPDLGNIKYSIIAGGRLDGQGFNPFLNGDNDGTVTVAETSLDGASAHLIVPALHATISNHPNSIQATLNFLKNGQLDSTE